MKTNIKNTTRHCVLANGSQIHLNQTVTVPIKLGLEVLRTAKHIHMKKTSILIRVRRMLITIITDSK